MTWEQAVKAFFNKNSEFNELLNESIGDEYLVAEADKVNSTFEGAKDILLKMGYKIKPIRNQIKVLAPNAERSEVMEKLKTVFMPLGYEFDSTRGGTYGVIKKLSRSEGSAFIVVKPDSSAGRAAQKGMEYEKELSHTIERKYGERGITVKTAGFGHGSDLEIEGPGGSMTIELKTSSGADFGQFNLIYSIDLGRWVVSPTKSVEKNKALFTGLFEDYLEEFMNRYADFPDLEDPRLKIVKGFVTGLNPHPETGLFKNEIQKRWFQDKADLRVPVDFETIASYYAEKGDSFIQIGGRGLYALKREDSEVFGVPLFEESGKKASIRFRLKPKMGNNGHHSFTVAIKLTIAKSDKDLTNEKDMDNIASILHADKN